MKIVILDGYSVNPGDLSWNALGKWGELVVYDRTAPEDIIGRCREAEIVLTNKVPFSAGTMSQLPALRYIGVLATGYNIIDTKAAAAQGIVVTNIPAYSTESVAQWYLPIFEYYQWSGEVCRAKPVGALVTQCRFLLLGYTPCRIIGKAYGYRRVGTYGHGYCPYCSCVRIIGLCLYVEVGRSTAFLCTQGIAR